MICDIYKGHAGIGTKECLIVSEADVYTHYR